MRLHGHFNNIYRANINGADAIYLSMVRDMFYMVYQQPNNIIYTRPDCIFLYVIYDHIQG